MNIHPLTQNDIDGCIKIFLQTYNCPPWNYNWKRESAVTYLNEYLLSPSFVGFTVYDGENIAAVLLAHVKTWWTNDQLYIDELFVSPQFQKRGFGKMLIKHAEDYARINGLKTITLMTNKFMPAMDFYESVDFIDAQSFTLLFKNIY